MSEQKWEKKWRKIKTLFYLFYFPLAGAILITTVLTVFSTLGIFLAGSTQARKSWGFYLLTLWLVIILLYPIAEYIEKKRARRTGGQGPLESFLGFVLHVQGI